MASPERVMTLLGELQECLKQTVFAGREDAEQCAMDVSECIFELVNAMLVDEDSLP